MMIIDIHGHAYPEKIARKVKERMEAASDSKIETDVTPEAIVGIMESSGVDATVFLPVATNPEQVDKLNTQAIQWQEEFGDKGWISFGAVHPDTEKLKDVVRGIKNAGLKGIKLHPDYQDIYFDDIRYLRILDAAAEEDLAVLVHAGVDEVYPNHVHCDVPRILNVFQHIEYERLILAHMGSWQMWEEVRKYICGAPVYFDTAFSLTGTVSVENNGVFGSMLSDEQFVTLSRAHGVEKILFGTDTPWGSQQENLDWIRGCSLNDEEKEQVLGRNAEKLLFIG